MRSVWQLAQAFAPAADAACGVWQVSQRSCPANVALAGMRALDDTVASGSSERWQWSHAVRAAIAGWCERWQDRQALAPFASPRPWVATCWWHSAHGRGASDGSPCGRWQPVQSSRCLPSGGIASSSWQEMQSSGRRSIAAAKPWQLWQARALADALDECTETATS